MDERPSGGPRAHPTGENAMQLKIERYKDQIARMDPDDHVYDDPSEWR